jgi:amino acid transporter
MFLVGVPRTGLGPLSSRLLNQLWGAVSITEREADNDVTESPEEHANAGGGTDRLFEAIQIAIAAMPLLAISSVVLAIVFFIQANRYHSPFETFLALWFLVLGSQACILFGTHIVGWKMVEHCCDDTNNSVNTTLWTILSIAFFLLSTAFIWRELAFTGRFGTTGLYMIVVTVALMIFFSIIWMLDTAYMIYEVMPIRVD